VLRTALVGVAIVLALTTGRSSNAADNCRLAMSQGGGYAERTGQHTLELVLTNRGSSACVLDGFPQVEFLDAAGRRLPFVISHRGDQMIRRQSPRRVRIAHGGKAYVAVNKYRCDGPELQRPARVDLVPPGASPLSWLSLRIVGIGYGWCGRGDPGSSVSVSPVVTTERAAVR
jgi:hypothetical protein